MCMNSTFPKGTFFIRQKKEEIRRKIPKKIFCCALLNRVNSRLIATLPIKQTSSGKHMHWEKAHARSLIQTGGGGAAAAAG